MVMNVDTAGQVRDKVSWVSAPSDREVADLCLRLTMTRQQAADTAADQVPFVNTSDALPEAVNSWLLTASAAAAAAAEADKSVMQGVGLR